MRLLGSPSIGPLVLVAFLLTSLSSLGHAQQRDAASKPLSQPSAQPSPLKTQQYPMSEAQQSIFTLRSLFNTTGQKLGTFTDRKCLMCKFSVSLVNYALKTKRGYDQVDKLANNFCNIAHLEAPLVCSQISKLFNHEITKVLTYGIVTPNQVCGLLSNNTCGHFHSPLDDWEVHLDASSQLIDKIQQLNKTTSSASKEARKQDAYRVIHISDTHIDLNYAEGSLVKCAEPLCCQKSSSALNRSRVLGDLGMGEPEVKETLAGFWGSYGHCDIPMRTFETALKFIGSMVDNATDIDYIIWTGDIQPHDVWAQNKRSATRVYDAVFAKIVHYLPKIKILPTLGNHEMIPVDSFSPSNLIDIARDDSPVWLYKKLNSFWSRWLPEDTVKTILKDGFYATTVREGLKVVSLNTNFCHSKNFWLFINSTDPGNQLQWLVHELQMSELLHEKVHIIGHIPPGAEDCMKIWSKNYNRILRRYQNTITGQFFGHTHNNEFELFYDQQSRAQVVSSTSDSSNKTAHDSSDKKQHRQQVIATISTLNNTLTSTGNLTKAILATAETNAKTASASLNAIKVGFIGPAITTFIGLNPSFRIYTIDPKLDFAPTDFETYYMNLTKANANTTQEPEWTSAGNFTDLFGLNDTSASSMHDLITEIANDLNVDADVYEEATESEELTTTTEKPDDKKEDSNNDDEEEMSNDDKLFELYRLFNSYSDEFDRSVYEKITAEDKRKFLCRLITGQAHDPTPCTEFIPTLTITSIASVNVTL